jgi:hypothetical protein
MMINTIPAPNRSLYFHKYLLTAFRYFIPINVLPMAIASILLKTGKDETGGKFAPFLTPATG